MKTIPFVEAVRTLGSINVGVKLNNNVLVDDTCRVIGVLFGDHLAEQDLTEYVLGRVNDPNPQTRRDNRMRFWLHILDEKMLGVHGGRYDGARVKPFYGDYWLVRTSEGIDLLDDDDIEKLELSADYMTMVR